MGSAMGLRIKFSTIHGHLFLIIDKGKRQQLTGKRQWVTGKGQKARGKREEVKGQK
ncbi:MAG: hypothetical protein ACXITR_11205 [Cyanobacterium sp.]